jgi:WD40 repeat protein
MGELDVGETCEHLAVSPNADQFAIGTGSDGGFKVFSMKENDFDNAKLVYVCQKHTKELTSLAFAPKGDMLVSAARDGTCLIWKDGKVLGTIECTVPDPPAGKKTRPQPVLVRGCAFGNLDGDLVVTLHSTKRSEAYLSLWKRNPDNSFECLEKSPCSKFPATALSVSMDKKLVALGDAEGTVSLWDKVEWKLIKKFDGVHGLPVSCLAARPLAHPFIDEDVPMHIRTGSLDCLAGSLSIFAKDPPKPRGLDSGKRGFYSWLFFYIYWTLTAMLLLMALYSMYPHATTICSDVNDRHGAGAAARCIFEEVLWISPQQLEIALPPI